MVRTQVYLSDEEYEALREVSYKEKSSISSIVRRLVDDQLLGKRKKKSNKAVEAFLSMAGMAHDSKTDVSERHDDYLWGEP